MVWCSGDPVAARVSGCAEECGAGVFMAAHWDRQYCGKCGLTYVFTNPEDEDGDLQQIQE